MALEGCDDEVVVLEPEQRAALIEAGLMDVRLQRSATGATIHRINNTRQVLRSYSEMLRSSADSEEARLNHRELLAAIARAWVLVDSSRK